MVIEVKDIFGFKDVVNLFFGDDLFLFDVFFGDFFVLEIFFLNDIFFLEKEDLFNLIDFLFLESFGELFYKFNVGVSI